MNEESKLIELFKKYQVNATYGDGGILHFKTMKGIKNYFEHVTIETQELISTGFKTVILNRETK